jgi:hypothetical protein
MYAPSPKDSKYKGVHLWFLLRAISNEIQKRDLGSGLMERLSWHIQTGLSRNIYKTIKKDGTPLKNPTKISSKFITNNYEKIINLVLGGKVKAEDLISVESLWEFIHSPRFKYENKLEEIKQRFRKYISEEKLEFDWKNV